MDYKMLDNILSDAVNDAELCCDDIPSISLYLDQIIHLISDKSHEGSPRFYGRTLTKTMINNYSKAGLITPVSGKKYTKEQIIQMLMINSLKNTFSISQIKGAMDAFYSAEDADSEALMLTYDKYVELRRKAKSTCPDAVKQMIEINGFEVEDDIDYFCAILGVVAMADYFNSMAHAMLEVVLPDEKPEESAADAKESKKAAKVAKKEKKKEDKAQKKAEKTAEKPSSKANETDSDKASDKAAKEEPRKSVHPDTEAGIADELSLLEKEVDRALDKGESAED